MKHIFECMCILTDIQSNTKQLDFGLNYSDLLKLPQLLKVSLN